ncbi:hypothetical protein MACH17_18430 [Phaeobacter inhibens]|uniref:hypothetical protein n=1 Tax=Phaeobacter inhibens TaxID=221822 RepID=UPI0027543C0A|nr:hypothetical protein [Phaeobacter inhibens]GLO70326.1 hypothetical protein MACH17_18430 [Phaeobacter inhibens]
MTQLSFLDTLDPPQAPTKWTPPPRRKVMTGAYGRDYELEIVENNPEPFEVEVRGIRALITYSVGFCTYTMDKPGELFWSETGFRSFGRATIDPDQIRAAIEAYIDAPIKDGSGCGGKLVRWWPIWVLQWCQNRTRDLEWCRDDVWTQWGADKHKESWDRHDREQLEALDRMKAEGIDPDAVISSHRPKQPPVSMIELTTGRAA